DKTIGAISFCSLFALFIYYTIWVLVMPFVDKGHPLHNYFLDWQYAIKIPLMIMIVCLTVILTFLALIMIK
ncbi:dolichyl-phosphate mannosyltransferase 2 regulatory subunit, partial [Rhizopus microsporus var. microsporus]